MIKSFCVEDMDRVSVSWYKKILPNLTHLEFTDGLNMIVGPNGCGKSTLLTMLSRYFHCNQGGIPSVTETSIRELYDFKKKLFGVNIIHDGQPVFYYSGDRKVGLVGGGAGFDWDFGKEGIVNCMRKASAGQDTIHECGRVMHAAIKTNKVDWKISRKRANDLWQKRIDRIETFLTARCPLGKKTIIMDEPERSLDMANQYELLHIFCRLCKEGKFQIIFCAHNPMFLALANHGANIIELKEGYYRKCVELKTKADTLYT